jgi:hypothetical protein
MAACGQHARCTVRTTKAIMHMAITSAAICGSCTKAVGSNIYLQMSCSYLLLVTVYDATNAGCKQQEKL